MAVPIGQGTDFQAGTPATLVKYPVGAARSYDVAPDGRFPINVPASSASDSPAARPQFVVVQNWFEELKARVPVK